MRNPSPNTKTDSLLFLVKTFYVKSIRKEIGVRISEGIYSKGLFAFSALSGNSVITKFEGDITSRAEFEVRDQMQFSREWSGEFMLECSHRQR